MGASKQGCESIKEEGTGLVMSTTERNGRIRVSLDLTPEMKRVIDELAAKQGATQAMIMRRAIALLKTITEAEEKGERPALIDGEGHVTARLVGV
jgi:hypothetical protein